MTADELQAAADAVLAEYGCQRAENIAGLDAGYVSQGGSRLGLALLPEQADAFAYLQAFEDGMRRLLIARQAKPADGLVLAMDVSSAAQAQAASYRRALNKYRSSVVFEDSEIGLLLLGHPSQQSVWLASGEVGTFLRGLDRWLLAA